MATYKSFKELQGNTLKEGDKLIFFKHVTFSVSDQIFTTESGTPERLFNFLGFGNGFGFSGNIYGYKAINISGFPGYKSKDYPAATRLALELFKEYEKMFPTEEEKVSKEKSNTFLISANKKDFEILCENCVVIGLLSVTAASKLDTLNLSRSELYFSGKDKEENEDFLIYIAMSSIFECIYKKDYAEIEKDLVQISKDAQENLSSKLEDFGLFCSSLSILKIKRKENEK